MPTCSSLYSADYATSPHCFDELDLALDRIENGDDLGVWLLRLDDTRLVPRRAREWQVDRREYGIVTRRAHSRDEIHQALTDEFLRLRSRS
jgi:hypothetical protein